MAYAIGYMLPIVGIIALIIWIANGLNEERKLNDFIKQHNEEIERRRSINK